MNGAEWLSVIVITLMCCLTSYGIILLFVGTDRNRGER